MLRVFARLRSLTDERSAIIAWDTLLHRLACTASLLHRLDHPRLFHPAAHAAQKFHDGRNVLVGFPDWGRIGALGHRRQFWDEEVWMNRRPTPVRGIPSIRVTLVEPPRENPARTNNDKKLQDKAVKHSNDVFKDLPVLVLKNTTVVLFCCNGNDNCSVQRC